jgi:hypothetical protein
MPVKSYQTTQSNIPEDNNIHTHRRENLRSHEARHLTDWAIKTFSVEWDWFWFLDINWKTVLEESASATDGRETEA